MELTISEVENGDLEGLDTPRVDRRASASLR